MSSWKEIWFVFLGNRVVASSVGMNRVKKLNNTTYKSHYKAEALFIVGVLSKTR